MVSYQISIYDMIISFHYSEYVDPLARLVNRPFLSFLVFLFQNKSSSNLKLLCGKEFDLHKSESAGGRYFYINGSHED